MAFYFGLLSAPFTYWDCRHGGINPADFTPGTRSSHYLHDFITTSHPESSQRAHNLSTAMEVWKHLVGLPLHPGKWVGPSTVLVVLCIELDSVNQVAPFPLRSCHPPVKLSFCLRFKIKASKVRLFHPHWRWPAFSLCGPLCEDLYRSYWGAIYQVPYFS